MSHKLSKKQIKTYNEEGFIVIDNVIDEHFLNKVKLATTKIVEKASFIDKSDDKYDLADNHSKGKPSVRRIKQPHSFDNIFKELLFYPSIIEKVKSLLGKNFRLHNGKMNSKMVPV